MNDLEFDDVLNIVLKGIISGFLIAYLILFGLRPSAEYPDNILEIIDNPWIFIILILLNIYIIQWDLTIGLLLLLSIISLILDIIIFTDGEIFNNSIYIDTLENFKDQEKEKDTKDDVKANGEKEKETNETKEGYKNMKNNEKEYKNKIAKIIDNLKDFLKFMRNNNNI